MSNDVGKNMYEVRFWGDPPVTCLFENGLFVATAYDVWRITNQSLSWAMSQEELASIARTVKEQLEWEEWKWKLWL